MNPSRLRPPRDLEVPRFFTEWLPAAFADEFGTGKRMAKDTTVSVRLHGDGGGRWMIDVLDNILTVRPEGTPGPAPMVTLDQTVSDWLALAVGEAGAVDLAPPEASPLDVLFVDPASRQIATSVRGTVRFELANFHGRTWWMLVKFGREDHHATSVVPDATIRMEAAVYGEILAKRLTPTEAYFRGDIELRGEAGLAMQLGMAILPRFA